MSDMIEAGIQWQLDQLMASAAQDVTIARGYDSIDVKATIGRTKLKTTDGSGGVKTEWTDKDFIIRASAYDFGDGPVAPERGDVIYWVRGSNTRVYEVRPYAFEPPYRDDAHELVYRVHAKLIRTE